MNTPYRYRVEEMMPGVTWRQVDEAYPESTGAIAPRTEQVLVLPLVPYTRLQRVLHRIGICRWHRHQSLARLFQRLRDACADARWDVVR